MTQPEEPRRDGQDAPATAGPPPPPGPPAMPPGGAGRESPEESQAKAEFLAMLGHELRNPLSAIRTALQVYLLRTEGSAPAAPRGGGGDAAESLHVIERQLRHVTRLVDDLLEVSRVTCGRIILRRQWLDLGKAVAELAPGCTPLVRERGHRLAVRVPPEPVWVEADPDRLEQVLSNLLHNAAKYTDEGGTLDVEVRPEGDEGVITVRDNGVGIAPEVLPRLFELFAAGPQPLDRSRGGLGIGLTLVRRLVELHGGQIRARSGGAGQGSEFEVRLPRARGEPAAAAAPPAPRVCAAPAGRRRILLVEDNHDNREMLRALLEMWGHEVDAAADGTDGARKALRQRPDIAVIDIGLPGLNGYEVAQQIRAAERAGTAGEGRTFLIALTGYGLPSDNAQALAAGFDVHLVKPVDVKRLLGVIQQGAPA